MKEQVDAEQRAEISKRVTRAVRLADLDFQKIGGTTMHYVHECLLPALEENGIGLSVVPINELPLSSRSV